jgi:hypothetical protein
MIAVIRRAEAIYAKAFQLSVSFSEKGTDLAGVDHDTQLYQGRIHRPCALMSEHDQRYA